MMNEIFFGCKCNGDGDQDEEEDEVERVGRSDKIE